MAANQPYQIEVRMFKIRINQPGYGPRIISFEASDLQAKDLSTQPCLFQTAGAPGATTLLPGNGAYIAGDECTDTTNVAKYLCTAGGTNASSVWKQISGGGGGSSIQQFKLVNGINGIPDGGDYWSARTWDGTNLGTITYSLIKPYKLRSGPNKITSETIRGLTYTYNYSIPTGLFFERSWSGSDGSSGIDYIIPDPLIGDVLYASPVSGTILAGNSIPYPVLSATLATAGIGFAANEVLTCAASTGSTGIPCQITVLTVDANGVILTFAITQNGLYFNGIANPIAFGGSQGTGATFNVTLQPPMIANNDDGRAWTTQ